MKKFWKSSGATKVMPGALREDDSSLKHNRTSGCNGYLLFRFAGKPVIAVPNSSPNIKLAGLKCYRGITIRRAGFAWMTRLLTRLRIDWLLTQPEDSSLSSLLPFNFQNLLDTLRQTMGAPSAEAVIVWPPQLNRGRIYVHLLDANARPLAFVKLSLDALNDEYLRSEAETIEKLKALQLKSFRIPSLLEIGKWNGHYYCVFEPIATDAKPVKSSWSSFPRDCVKEYAGQVRIIGLPQLTELKWWKKFWEVTPPESAFAQDVRMAEGHAIRVCRAHGDLGTMNMIRVDREILIFDWEECCDDAPILTDELMFFLVLNQRKFLAKPVVGLRELNQRYLSGASAQRRCDVIMAMAFIRASDKPVANKILDNWEKENAQTQ
ncbi:MAG: hypothetical protein HKP32_06970 [Woeseia sp.]|nr:hypothetical protein [Woeseia sp.]